MWRFINWKRRRESPHSGPPCPHCHSQNTQIAYHHSISKADQVKTWRGQRYLNCTCFTCGREFYIEEPPGFNRDPLVTTNEFVDDAEALAAAEAEIKQQTEEDNDRMYR